MTLPQKIQLLQTSNDLSTKHLTKVILYENNSKLLIFNRIPV